MMMGRNGLLPAVFAKTHPQYETPNIALGTISLVVAVVATITLALGRAAGDAFSDTATLCSFGFVIVYGAIAAGASLYLRGRGELRASHVVMSAIAVALLVVPAVGSVYPVPPPPGNWYPYAFLLYVACGLALLWRRRTIAADGATQARGIGGAIR
jgi:amino acid transporter